MSLRGGGASGSDVLGDHHGYLLRMRLEGGLEGIEIGPIMGRGSYGKVFKGESRQESGDAMHCTAPQRIRPRVRV